MPASKYEERRARIAKQVGTLGEKHLQVIEDILNLESQHLERTRTLIRNQMAIAEVARLMRMFNRGSFE